MTRQEHLDWAKERALAFVDAGDLAGAYASFRSDMTKHDELRDHPALRFTDHKFIGGMLRGPDQMRREIEGFN